MGATVTVAKSVAAFQSSLGNVFYVLFEQLYEKNCYPHTPRWSCVGFGTLPDMLRLICRYASSCEGGMLQTPRGQLKPENYIAGWIKELKSPKEMRDRIVGLKVGTSWASTIPAEAAEKAFAVLDADNRKGITDTLRQGSMVELSLHQDAELLAQIYTGGLLSISCILPCTGCAPLHNGVPAPQFGFSPATGKASAHPLPRALRIGETYHILRPRADGSWFHAGWEYELVSDYVTNLWETLLFDPQSVGKRVGAFRQAIGTSPTIPLGISVAIDRTVPVHEYAQQDIEDLMQRNPVTVTDRGFKVISTDSNLYHLCRLPRDCTTWEVPEMQVPMPAEMGEQNMRKPEQLDKPRQLDLF